MKKISKLKNLISTLESLESFSNPKDYLEQYQTSPQISGEIFHYILNKFQDEISNMKIGDLGCGNGILGISAALIGCKDVVLFDIDEEIIDIAKQNVNNLELQNCIQIILCDVNQIKNWKCLYKKFDIIVTNPPFGIRSQNGADVEFLKCAVNLSNQFVYSLHKFSTFNFLKKFYEKNNINDVNGFKIEYDLPKSYKFHKKNNKVIDVLCLEANVGDNVII
jgi:predicted RNA methylase